MDKYLVTGSSGFVSRHFVNYLESNKLKSKILGVDLNKSDLDNQHLEFVDYKTIEADLLDLQKVYSILSAFKPNYVLHLASFSSVSFSWKEPILTFLNNTNIFLNLAETIRRLGIKCRIISVGSSEEYGTVDESNIPIKENDRLLPSNPYAVARVSQEMLSRLYATGYDLDVICTRSFNHIGPYQKDVFVIPSFARQLVGIKKHKCRNGMLVAGDVSIVRDFVDVRDVVRAYYMLLKNGKTGDIYNISTGKGYSLKDVINIMCRILDISVKIKIDRNLIRAVDSKVIVGSNEKIKTQIGWMPNYSLQQSLEDVVQYWASVLYEETYVLKSVSN